MTIDDLKLEPRVYVPTSTCPDCDMDTIWMCWMKYWDGISLSARFCSVCSLVLPRPMSDPDLKSLIRLMDMR